MLVLFLLLIFWEGCAAYDMASLVYQDVVRHGAIVPESVILERLSLLESPSDIEAMYAGYGDFLASQYIMSDSRGIIFFLEQGVLNHFESMRYDGVSCKSDDHVCLGFCEKDHDGYVVVMKKNSQQAYEVYLGHIFQDEVKALLTKSNALKTAIVLSLCSNVNMGARMVMKEEVTQNVDLVTDYYKVRTLLRVFS